MRRGEGCYKGLVRQGREGREAGGRVPKKGLTGGRRQGRQPQLNEMRLDEMS